jgi:excisionase family DNA binding protein
MTRSPIDPCDPRPVAPVFLLAMLLAARASGRSYARRAGASTSCSLMNWRIVPMTRPPDLIEPLLLDVRTVARLLNVSVRTIHRLKATGEMPAPVRLGGRVLWRRAELLAWLEVGCPSRLSTRKGTI